MSDATFAFAAKELRLTIEELYRRYDTVIHLVTAAKGAAEFYTLANNLARTETPAQALELDARTQRAWLGHGRLMVIGNAEQQTCPGCGTLLEKPVALEQKLHRLLRAVMQRLQMPVPLEIERKFLLDPSVDPASFPVAVLSFDIRQTYLRHIDSAVERRVRERKPARGDEPTYFYTEKRVLRPGVREEHERLIDGREYAELLRDADPESAVIEKTRYTFTWKDQYFELDVFRSPVQLALLEAELTEERATLALPPFVPVVRDVTDDDRYTNAAIAAGALESSTGSGDPSSSAT